MLIYIVVMCRILLLLLEDAHYRIYRYKNNKLATYSQVSWEKNYCDCIFFSIWGYSKQSIRMSSIFIYNFISFLHIILIACIIHLFFSFYIVFTYSSQCLFCRILFNPCHACTFLCFIVDNLDFKLTYPSYAYI